MRLNTDRSGALLGCVLLAAWPTVSGAAVVTVDELATPEEVRTSREVIVSGPLSFKTFIDRLSVPAPAVTLTGGDTLNFRLALDPASRFAISTIAQVFSVGIEMQSSPGGTAAERAGDDPTVVLLAPDDAPPPGGRFTAYSVDSASGRVTSLSAVQQFGGPPPAVALDAPKTSFSGFDGTVVLPADFPSTSFDVGVSLMVTGQFYRASDPPPPLAYLTTVPEPAGFAAVAVGATIAGFGRRRRHPGCPR